MSKAEFNISRQLQFWLDKTGRTVPQLCRYFNGMNKKKVVRWLEGGLVRIDTLHKISKFFDITPEQFYGKPIRSAEGRPCGIRKVLEIINREGDYFGEDTKSAIHFGANSLIKPIHGMHRTTDER